MTTYAVSLNTWGGTSLPNGTLTKELLSVAWCRSVDATAFGEFSVPTPDEGCCGALAEIAPMCSAVSVQRDGEEVFYGPIYEIVRGAVITTVRFADLTYWFQWMMLRDPLTNRLARNFTSMDSDVWGSGIGARDSALIAESWINTASTLTDPGWNLIVEESGDVSERLPTSVRLDTSLRDLMDSSVDITAVGRNVLIRGESAYSVLPSVTEQSYFGGGLEVRETAAMQVNAAFSQSTVIDEVALATEDGSNRSRTQRTPGVDRCPWVESWAVDDEVASVRSLAASARGRLVRGERAMITTPTDSSLDLCAYGASINDLVPGAVADVKVERCRSIASGLRLSSLCVTFDASGERIAPTWSPLQLEV